MDGKIIWHDETFHNPQHWVQTIVKGCTSEEIKQINRNYWNQVRYKVNIKHTPMIASGVWEEGSLYIS